MEDTAQTTIQLPAEALEAVKNGIDYSDNRDWIPWAWAALVRAGDVSAELDEFDEEYASHIITLAALGYLFERFHDVYAGVEGDDELTMQFLGTDRPDITAVDVARYCERHGYASGECPETGEGLLQVAVESRRVEVKFRLREVLGDSRLFTSLIVAGRPLPLPEFTDDGEEIETESLRDPLAEDAFDSYVTDVTSDLSGNQPQAYEWLRGHLGD
ncbi:hypothetical protein [Brevibacterium zhoupengii]|uniref:hypothetical protein n=1 Tax=Brevibacterium zhoupengii TaxID=2898795 RepID=UPI001F08B251|nr:hypothetical protein [Brevibacterium zhoupengii]